MLSDTERVSLSDILFNIDRVLDQLAKGDVLMVTRLDRLARSTRDLLNTLAAITAKGAGFRSLHDAWADTTTGTGV
jgi:DNA invertase Pin-like site-specific DNA recombinase